MLHQEYFIGTHYRQNLHPIIVKSKTLRREVKLKGILFGCATSKNSPYGDQI